MLVAPLLVVATLAAPPPDAVLAEADGFQITAAEYVAKMNELSPTARASYASIERKREFLDNLVRFKVLAAEARRQGLDRDPDVLAALEKLLVQKLVQRAFADAGRSDARPAEAELRAYFDAHRADYQRPAKVRVAIRRFDAEPEARAFLTALSAPRGARHGPDTGGDGEAEAGPSDAAAGQPLTDEGFLSREELAARHGAAVAKAAFARAIGELRPIVVGERGAFVLRVDARQEALDRTFEQVKEQLAAKLSREVRTKEFDATVARLRKEARVRIDGAVLDRVVVE
jgi:peptidyl-prolyl cis-trans isomerase C